MNGDDSIPWERFVISFPWKVLKIFTLSTEGLIPFIIELCRKIHRKLERDLNFPLSLFLSCLPLIKKKKVFRNGFRFMEKNCKDSTETSHVFLHPISPISNSLHECDTFVKINEQILFTLLLTKVYIHISLAFTSFHSYCCCCSVILFRIPCYI